MTTVVVVEAAEEQLDEIVEWWRVLRVRVLLEADQAVVVLRRIDLESLDRREQALERDVADETVAVEAILVDRCEGSGHDAVTSEGLRELLQQQFPSW